MKQMTTVRITAFRISHTYTLQCIFEYNMNKSRNKFELLPMIFHVLDQSRGAMVLRTKPVSRTVHFSSRMVCRVTGRQSFWVSRKSFSMSATA